MTTYNYFYAPATVNSITQTESGSTINTGNIYLGVRAQELLLLNNNFYKKCGLFLPSEIVALVEPNQPDITSFIISSTKDVQRLSLLEELTFTLIPVDDRKTLNPFNKKYNTGLPYSTFVSRYDMVTHLKAVVFKFSSGGDIFEYKVLTIILTSDSRNL